MTEHAAAERYSRAFGTSCWAIDSATHDGETVTIIGWALAPEGRSQDVVFTANGRPFDEQHFPLDRDDLTELLWFRANVRASGFECRIRLTADELESRSLMLQFSDRVTGQPFDMTRAYFMPTPASADRGLALPDAPRMFRTTGNENAANFRLTGLSTAIKLREAVVASSRDFAGVKHVLDWGCGCGRIARFCTDWPGFTGVDIDADNVQWCADNLPFGDFRAIDLYPPTPLPDRRFDLIFGISVMTHLAEDAQQQWLAELHRISAPYAIVLLTTLGEHAAARAGLDAQTFAQIVGAGSSFHPTANAIDDALGNTGYYGTTFMTHNEIRRKWSRWFSVDRVIPAYIGNHQDLVVLRRR
ncbi:MAG: class I SAM-dependent methyltransferase [Casimicrobiaceae bacterium]